MQGDNIPLEEMRRVQREEKRRLLRTPHEEWKTRQRTTANAAPTAASTATIDATATAPQDQRKVEALKIKKSRITEAAPSIDSTSEDDTTGSDSLGLSRDSPLPQSDNQKKDVETTANTTSSSTTTSTTTTTTNTTASRSTTKVKHKKRRTSKTT